MEDGDPSNTLSSQPALAEVAQVRQLQREKGHLLEMNKHYLTSMSQLEVKLADFRALLKLKDKELDLLRTISASDPPLTEAGSMKALQELEGKILRLEEENRQLKQMSALSVDVDRLKHELSEAVDLKASYEEQFKEATVRMLTIEQEDTSMVPDEELQGRESDLVTQLQYSNQALHRELEAATQTLNKVKQERDFLRAEVIPVLEQTIKLYELEKNELERKLEELKTKPVVQKPEVEERQVPRPQTTMNNHVAQTQTATRPKSSLSPKQQPVASHGKPMVGRSGGKKSSVSSHYIYSPSFLRGKKTNNMERKSEDKKPTEQVNFRVKTSKAKTVEDHFADDFPEENELT